MNLLARVLRWDAAVAVPSTLETDWREVGCSGKCRFEHTVLTGQCGYARRPVRVLDDSAPVAEETGCELDELLEPAPSESESRVMERLAELSTRMSPWEAASCVFGGAGVARETSCAALSATERAEPSGSVHR